MQRVDPAWMVLGVGEVLNGSARGDDGLREDLAPENPAVWHRLAAPDEDIGVGPAEVGPLVGNRSVDGHVRCADGQQVEDVEQVLQWVEDGAALGGGHERDDIGQAAMMAP